MNVLKLPSRAYTVLVLFFSVAGVLVCASLLFVTLTAVLPLTLSSLVLEEVEITAEQTKVDLIEEEEKEENLGLAESPPSSPTMLPATVIATPVVTPPPVARPNPRPAPPKPVVVEPSPVPTMQQELKIVAQPEVIATQEVVEPLIVPSNEKPEPVILVPPTTLSPSNNQVVNLTAQKALVFNWQMDSRVTHSKLVLYYLDPSLSSGSRIIHTKTLIKGNSYQFSSLNLLNNGHYRWTLENFLAGSASVTNESSEGNFSLTLDPLDKVVITSPLRYQLNVSPNQRIEWKAVARATRYRVLITVDDEKKTKMSDTTTTALFVNPRLLARRYNVTVMALDEFSNPSSSTTINITVEEG